MSFSNNSNFSAPEKPLPTCLFNKEDYDLFCLIPSFIIITVLAFLNKRVRIKPDVCGGRPGLVLPINFLGDKITNRLSIAVAFGVIADNCFLLFNELTKFNAPSFALVRISDGGIWMKALTSVVFVLLYGMINFPIFACLMTEHKFVGAVFGLLYTLMKFIEVMLLVFSCPSVFTKDVVRYGLDKAFHHLTLYENLPGLFFHLFLLVRFFVLLVKEIRKKWVHCLKLDDVESDFIAKEHNHIYVRNLLGKGMNKRPSSWYLKLRDKIYKPRADFKFSTGVISSLTVSAIFIYRMTVAIIVDAARITKMVKDLRKRHEDIDRSYSIFFSVIEKAIDIYTILEASFYSSFAFTSTFSVLMLLHFMKCHRDHVLKSYKTKNFLDSRPSRLVGRSLSYPGYQIAYVGWGYVVMATTLFLLSIIIGFLNRYMPRETFYRIFVEPILPYIVISIFVWIFQYLLGLLVFRDRRFPNVTININNHRLYCVMSFFFFFFNILVGFFSSIFRLLKSMFLGFIFLSRIDRTPMMSGYKKWDKGYMSYIGFLNVLKSFSHPVMLVFCQLLVDSRVTEYGRSQESGYLGESVMMQSVVRKREKCEPGKFHRVSKTALNRWLVAYTLLKNPALQRLRKQKLKFVDIKASGEFL